MTTSTTHPGSMGASLTKKEAGTPWSLYAALGLFLVGIVLKAFSVFSVG